MSSERLNTTATKPDEEKSSATHWVYCIAKENDMKVQADLWVGNRNAFSEKYEALKTTSNLADFSRINNVDTLHIYGHGEKGKNVVYHGDIPLSPKDFLKFLKSNKLDKDHRFLEINVCYSDKFSEQLAIIAKKDYPNLRISGYPGQFVPCQGDLGENFANLEEPYVIKHKGRWVLNREILTDANEADYYAEKHRQDFFTSPQKDNALLSSESAAVSTSVSSVTANSNVISRSYQTRRASTSSYAEYQSVARESLPRRASWADVSAKASTLKADKSTENTVNTNKPAALDMTEQSKQNVDNNLKAKGTNNNIDALELGKQENKNNGTIPDEDQASPPTPRR
jgi:hypothetical protein